MGKRVRAFIVSSLLGLTFSCKPVGPDEPGRVSAIIIAVKTARVGQTVTLDGSSSSDPQGRTLSFAWLLTNKPAESSTSLSGTDQAQAKFTADIAGAYQVSLQIMNALGETATATAVINATQGNVPPVARAGADREVAVGAQVQLDGSQSSDTDGDTLGYGWILTSKPAASTAALQGPTTVRPTFVADQPGDYVIALVVNDESSSSELDTVAIKAVRGNRKPTAMAGADREVKVGATVALNGSTSSDPDGDAITYAWTLKSKPQMSSATLSGATTVAPSFVADKAGDYVFDLLVNDGKISSDTDSVVITAKKDNLKPTAAAGTNREVASGSTVQLDGSSSSDLDGDSLKYLWSIKSVPAESSAVLSDTTAVKPTFVADKDGSYVVSLVVNDGQLSSEPATVTITAVRGNTKPIANAGVDREILLPSAVTLDGSLSSDGDNDPLTYRWKLVSKPNLSFAVLSNNTAAKPTFTPDIAGSYVFELIVNDGKIDSDADTVMITAVRNNTKPIARAGSDQFVKTGQIVKLDGSNSSDADFDLLQYRWSFKTVPAQSTAQLQAATSGSPTFTPDQPGDYVIELVVNDGTVDSDPDNVVITVFLPCVDQCSINSQRCTTDGIQTCGLQTNGCLDWGAAVACYKNRPCSGNSCAMYKVGGTVTGLVGNGLSIAVTTSPGGMQTLSITNNGAFAFANLVADGATYDVKIAIQPTGSKCTLASGMGTVDGADVANVQITCQPVVEPLYSGVTKWNKYVANDQASPFLATGAACNPNQALGYQSCIHAGERRQVFVPSRSTCDNLTATDALDAFDWVCDASQATIRMVSIGLKDTKGLADLVNFDTVKWRENSVTVSDNGKALSTTLSTVWWTSPVRDLSAETPINGGSSRFLDEDFAVFLVRKNEAYHVQIQPGAQGVAVAVRPGFKLRGFVDPFFDSETVLALEDFAWLEGDFLSTAAHGHTLPETIVLPSPATSNGFTSRFSMIRRVTADSIVIGSDSCSLRRSTIARVAIKGQAEQIFSFSATDLIADANTNLHQLETLYVKNLKFAGQGTHLLEAVLGAPPDIRGDNHTIQSITSPGEFVIQTNYSIFSNISAASIKIQQANHNLLQRLFTPIGDLVLINSDENRLFDFTAFALGVDAGSTGNHFSGILHLSMKQSGNIGGCAVDASNPNPGIDANCNPVGVSDHTATIFPTNALLQSVTCSPGLAFQCGNDWRLKASDQTAREVLPLPTGNNTVQHTWKDGSQVTFLQRAVEAAGGDSDGLCESNELCLFSPNMGYYQGHGGYNLAGTFVPGALTNIGIYRLATNGY